MDSTPRSVHSSPFHLARVFRTRTGFTIHGYRNQLRLRSSLDPLFDVSWLDVRPEGGSRDGRLFTARVFYLKAVYNASARAFPIPA